MKDPMHDNVNIEQFLAAVNAIPDAKCDYEHPGYFAIYWKGRVYNLGTANCRWQFQSARIDDEYEIWGDNSLVSLEETATTQELLTFARQHILLKRPPLHLVNMYDAEATTLDDFQRKLETAVDALQEFEETETTGCCAPTPAEKRETVALAKARVKALQDLMPFLEKFVEASDALLLHLDPRQ